MEVHPTGAGIGAEIAGVDLTPPLDDTTVAAIRAAWLDHLVLIFRGQRLGDDALAAFSARFGALDTVPNWEAFSVPGQQHVLVISNVTEDGKPIGVLGDGEAAWHTDMSYIDAPPTASILHALEVPPDGGDTSWINMYAAYETLPAELKAETDGLILNHDATTDSGGSLRPGLTPYDDVSVMPGARHPLVRVHPETGRKALFLGRRLNAWVVGKSVADSEALLDRLWDHVARNGVVYRHRWRVGDLLMWDNRCTMHRRESFEGLGRRIMHRTQIKGDRPVGVTADA